MKHFIEFCTLSPDSLGELNPGLEAGKSDS
jgi:hypothetical protein